MSFPIFTTFKHLQDFEKVEEGFSVPVVAVKDLRLR